MQLKILTISRYILLAYNAMPFLKDQGSLLDSLDFGLCLYIENKYNRIYTFKIVAKIKLAK